MKAFPSPVYFLNVIARIGATRSHSVVRYGLHSRHVLDIYPAAKGGPSPVIVFFYGGGWEDGERSDYLFVGQAPTERGFTTVIPDYSAFPEVRSPGFLQDAAEAMRWRVDHIAGFGGDPRRVIAMGHSAGTHIAAMLAFDRKWLLGLGLDASVDLRAIIGLAGPYDFLPLHSRTLKRIFGPENYLAGTQPINFVDAVAPPAFLATGNNDRTVEPGNTIRVTERIRCIGGEAETKLYDRLNHRTLIGAFVRPLRFLGPILDDVAGFALKHTDQQVLAGRPAAQDRSA